MDLGSAFTNVTVIPELSSASDDYGPAISHDGLTMYLARDTAAEGRDIFIATRATADVAWGMPARSAELSSPLEDDTPSPTLDGLALVLRSDRDTPGASDVYLATRATTAVTFGTPEALAAINSASVDEGATISSDGLTVMFGSNRPGGHGGFDLYMATRETRADPFGAPVDANVLASDMDDDDATFSEDGLTVVFSSNRGGNEDLWTATRPCL